MAITPQSNARSVLLSAAGRRVALLRILRDSMQELELAPRVIATDLHRTSPAMLLADSARVVPPYRDPQCLPQLLQIIRDQGVFLLVPTIDPELPFYALHRQQMEEAGCRINISSPQAIEIGF